jgi:phenylacetate-CoA ligase
MGSLLWQLPIRAFESGVKRRNTFRYLRELERTQWLRREELEAVQLRALQRLVAHAAERCPYYRDTWRSLGLNPAELTTHDHFRRWPVIDQRTVRENRLAMRAQVPGMRLLSKATGGSTGIPLELDLNPDSYDRRFAASFRGYSWASAGPGTKQLYLWGGMLGDVPRWKRIKNRWYEGLYRRRVLDCFHFGPDRADDFVAELDRYRPDVIVAYTNPLYEFARVLDETGRRPFTPASVVVGAEKLHDFQRAVIERVFRAPVFETYGCREFMLIGAECERHTGLHVTAEQLAVEVLDDDGAPVPAGTEGNVVITDLYNYGMPFVRYMNGDRAIAGAEACPCGRGLPLLQKVVGRRLDVLVTRDGRTVPGEFFPHFLKDFSAVRRFQVIQSSPDDILLRLVLGPSWSQTDQARVEAEVRKVIGPRCRFTIEVVNDIPLTPAGKHRVVVNLCQRPGREPAPRS